MKPLVLKFWNEPQPIVAVLATCATWGQAQAGLPAWAHIALGALGVVATAASARVG